MIKKLIIDCNNFYSEHNKLICHECNETISGGSLITHSFETHQLTDSDVLLLDFVSDQFGGNAEDNFSSVIPSLLIRNYFFSPNLKNYYFHQILDTLNL